MGNNEIGYILACITTLAWGLVVIPVKMSGSPGNKGIAFSMPAGIIILLPFFIYTMSHFANFGKITGADIFFIVSGGICQFPLATICYYEAIRSGEISTVAPLKCLKAAMVVGLVFILGIESLTTFTVIGCLIGITGAFVLTAKKRDRTAALDNEAIKNIKKGLIFVLLACSFWSIGDLLINEVAKNKILPSTIITPVSLFAGCVVFYGWIVFRKKVKDVFQIPRRDKICYCVHGVVSFGIGYGTFFAAMSYIGPGRSAIITNAWPLISFFVGIFLYREKITFQKILGAFLLLSSIYFVMAS